MAETLTWQVLQAIQTALSEIDSANGYRTDIGAQAHLEATDVPEDTPSVLVSETEVQANTDLSLSQRQRSMSVDIEASVPGDWSTGRHAIDAALDDIETALTRARETCLAPVGVSVIKLTTRDITDLRDGASAITGTWHCDVTYIRK